MTTVELLEMAYLRYECKIGVLNARKKLLQNKHIATREVSWLQAAKEIQELIDKCHNVQLALHTVLWDTKHHGNQEIIHQWRNL